MRASLYFCSKSDLFCYKILTFVINWCKGLSTLLATRNVDNSSSDHSGWNGLLRVRVARSMLL